MHVIIKRASEKRKKGLKNRRKIRDVDLEFNNRYSGELRKNPRVVVEGRTRSAALRPDRSQKHSLTREAAEGA